TFPTSGRDSTVDGVLQGSALALTYSSADGGVAFVQLTYDSTRQTWRIARSEVAYFDASIEAENPTIAIDDLGVAWCGFAAIDRATQGINLRLIYRPSDGLWLNTGLIIGPTDKLSRERSA